MVFIKELKTDVLMNAHKWIDIGKPYRLIIF